MPRKKLIRTDQFFYHVTTRSSHKEWFKIPLDKVWLIVIKSFELAQLNCPANVSQFVLMSNHYHLLIRTPNNDIDRFMYYFNKTFSDLLRVESKMESKIFGSNYRWSLIVNIKHFENVFYYIYQNPVRANIVKDCEEYPYSTFYYTYRGLTPPFPFTNLKQIESRHDKINDCFDDNKNLRIRKGLLKTTFKEANPR